MLRNYLQISVAVLIRRKFLTFINVFGATLTLTVLVVAFAIVESAVSPAGAQRNQNHILSVSSLELSDSRPFGSTVTWGPGLAFHERYIASLESPDRISYSMTPITTTSYHEGRKITSQMRRIDAAYWEILDFSVLEGRVLFADDVDQGRFVAVINEATADTYFPGKTAVGETIVVASESYEIVGVVANEPVTSDLAYADIWVPLTTSAEYRDSWVGFGQAMLYVEDPSRRRAVQAEYQQALDGFDFIDDPAEFDTATSAALTGFEWLVRETFSVQGEVNATAISQFIGIATAVALLFMSLPAINMANLNIGRILERAPEIGLRKAVGASKGVLIGQFIFENVVLCALGGLLAFAITPIVLGYLNNSFVTYGRLTLNVPIFAAGFVFILVFGVLSGAYPAWKMARLEPAAALRGSPHA